MLTPRPYQSEAIDSAISFFKSDATQHGLEILPTGSGKSLVIANIAKNLEGNTVIFQPSKEILEQNFAKFLSYGYRASIYSASLKQKHIDKVTFATIGSVHKKKHLFKEFQNVLIDECHTVNAEEGMYKSFLDNLNGAKFLGLTATPYRLTTDFEGAMLKFITRSRPKVFSKVLYYVQNDVLFNNGFLAPLEYYSFNVIDRGRLEMNAAGTDFTSESLKEYYRSINMTQLTIKYGNMILSKRRNCLIFCSLVEEAKQIARGIPGAVVITGETETSVRTGVLKNFIAGKIRCVVNVGVWTTGVDIPQLEAVLLSKSTMSLAYFYQVVGRVMRPYTYPDGSKKIGWVVDLAGNIKFFGKIETMKIEKTSEGLFYISNNGRQLTDVAFSKN